MRSHCKVKGLQYQRYVIALLITLLIYPLTKTLVDLKILLSTHRVVATQDWVALAIREKEEIASNTESDEKRILIVSGSNALFGISAKQISQETDIKTINLGLHGGLGGGYILSRVKRLIREGDIVVLPLEYGVYSSSGISDDFKNDPELARFLMSYDRSSLQKISPISLANRFFSNAFSSQGKKEYLKYFQGELSREDVLKRLKQQSVEGGCYSGLTLNKYGDETCNIVKEDSSANSKVVNTALFPAMTDIDPGGYIADFVQFATEKGVKIIPLYPVSTYTEDYQDPVYRQSLQSIKMFWESQGLEFQDTLESSLLPPELMYDTMYHPNDLGRQKRTQAVITLIQQQLNGMAVRNPN